MRNKTEPEILTDDQTLPPIQHYQKQKSMHFMARQRDVKANIRTVSTYIPNFKLPSRKNNKQTQQTTQSSTLEIKSRSLKNKLMSILQFGDVELVDNMLSLMAKISTNPIKNSTEDNINELVDYLAYCNLLFRKLPHHVSYSLLKIGEIERFGNRQLIYKVDDPSKYFYIILYGKVGLIHRKHLFRKICRAGEIFGQEILFCDNPTISKIIKHTHGAMPRLESARTHSKCFVLKIEPQMLEQLGMKMARLGHKHEFKFMESIIYRQFSTKMSLRQEHFF